MQNYYESALQAFENYRANKLNPIPIPYLNGKPSKHRIDEDWHIAAANNSYIADDFRRRCNIAILLGGEKNVADVDVDAIFALRIAAEVLAKLPKTFCFGRKNKLLSHYIFYLDQSLPSVEIRDPITKKMIIEFRCLDEDGSRGHKTVFPPSIHYDPETGIEEPIEVDPSSATEIATVPSKKLVKLVCYIGAVALLSFYFPVTGNRHNAILALAGLFARAGKSVEFALEVIVMAYRHSEGFNHDLSKVQSDIRGVYKALDKSPDTHLYGYPTLVQIFPAKVIDKILELLQIERQETIYPLTDSGNGAWLVDTYGDQLRYCLDSASWLSYDAARGVWVEGDMPVRELAKKRGNALRQQAERLTKPQLTGDEALDHRAQKRFADQQRAIIAAGNRAENAEGIRGTLFAASSDPRIGCSRCEFDKHDNLLNVLNGVIDLYTGELLPHAAKYMLTKQSPTEYDPKAKHEVWDNTLAAITRHHPDLLEFLQIAIGYSVQGNKTEERIFACFGDGGTGKGTIFEAIRSACGEGYVCSVAPETFLQQKRNSAAASGDIARLAGKRIVVVSELEKGNRLQEGMLKSMSGNDAIVARHLNKSETEFRPTFQFWFQTNNRLGFDSTDSGNKRRFVEIPFDNVLAKDPLVKFDRNLKSWMRTDKDFQKAVLAWIVEGCIQWRKHGLQLPESVLHSTEEMFANNDFLSDFIKEECVVASDNKVFLAEMKFAYELYCSREGEEPARGRTFNNMLEERGYERRAASIGKLKGKAWHGIRLKTPEEQKLEGYYNHEQSQPIEVVPIKRRGGLPQTLFSTRKGA